MVVESQETGTLMYGVPTLRSNKNVCALLYSNRPSLDGTQNNDAAHDNYFSGSFSYLFSHSNCGILL